MKMELFVPDISCGHCKMRIERGVGALPGVKVVEVDVSTKTVRVEGEVEAAAVKRVIEDLGYTV